MNIHLPRPALALPPTFAAGAHDDVKPPAVLSELMVPQRDIALALWGTAKPEART